MKISVIIVLSSIFLLVAFNAFYIIFVGESVPEPNISRESRIFGSAGSEIKFAVIGDSLTVGQGGDYEKGIVVTSAEYLAQTHKVTMISVGVSGARTSDALNSQLPKVLDFSPDVVLLTISANDITHMTPLSSVERDFREIISKLKMSNPKVKIIITGSPAMGSVPRFPWPTNVILTNRANSMNKRFDKIAYEQGLYFARVAERTGKQFAEDDSLSAEDKFHPSDKGYALWNEVIGEQLNQVTR